MTSRLAEMTSRNFSPSLAPELSGEARKAVNAAFDAMSTWRTETVDSFEIVVDKMANRRCYLCANAGCHQNADPNDGSADGRVGGTDQITELVIGNTIEAAVHLQL